MTLSRVETALHMIMDGMKRHEVPEETGYGPVECAFIWDTYVGVRDKVNNGAEYCDLTVDEPSF